MIKHVLASGEAALETRILVFAALGVTELSTWGYLALHTTPPFLLHIPPYSSREAHNPCTARVMGLKLDSPEDKTRFARG